MTHCLVLIFFSLAQLVLMWWFSPGLTRLLRRVLDTSPPRRATAAEIMGDEWFKVGFRRFSFRVEDDRSFTRFDLDNDASTSPPEPDTSRADAAAAGREKPRRAARSREGSAWRGRWRASTARWPWS
jgi:hypothetical protein